MSFIFSHIDKKSIVTFTLFAYPQNFPFPEPKYYKYVNGHYFPQNKITLTEKEANQLKKVKTQSNQIPNLLSDP